MTQVSEMVKARIGIRQVRNLQHNSTLWDESVSGFGIRRQEGDGVAYILKYRTGNGRQRWLTIGRHGAPWTPDTARNEAKNLLGRIARGEDPAASKAEARTAKTVAQLCDSYLSDALAGRVLTRRQTAKSESTLATDRGRIVRHIKPLLGSLAVAAVTTRDIQTFLFNVAEGKSATRQKTDKKRGLAVVTGGKGAASRTVGLLGGIFSYAVAKGLRTDNPVRGVIRYADNQRERRLLAWEYALVNVALTKAAQDGFWPGAVAVAKFLVITGWRSGEATNLRWAELDLSRRIANLQKTKTGKSVRPLSIPACAILKAMPRAGEYVFPAISGDAPMRQFYKFWSKIAKYSELAQPNGLTLSLAGDITPQTFRHSFASEGNDMQYSEYTVGSIIGHKRKETMTARYIHTIDTVLLHTCDEIAGHLVKLMESDISHVRAA